MSTPNRDALLSADQIRQSFLDFFREKGHTIVPSASLLPQSPGLLFTNAGMNQFVPYFLGTEKPPYTPPRATDTQKCIRAGGKHNDLEDVGYDTYHHTSFEMLGNWSFGDYFKEEAIAWAWELLVDRWKVPPNRLYATVYAPNKEKGDPGEFDQEAYDLWARHFTKAGLDTAVHIVHGNVKDNFWMMGETGPCGPCSELHIDLTDSGDTRGSLVNADSDQCIEIWNLVFIQHNAEADGTFRDLPARHVDTGMGFERACSMIQCTNGFQNLTRRISNYDTDVFRPLISRLEELSGRHYEDVYPASREEGARSTDSTLLDAIAIRVLTDHVRTLGFSIADGILPGHTGRNYVLRRILRRAVRYGRRLGFSGNKPVLATLADTFITQMGSVFPEIKERSSVIKETLQREEASFNETLDRGLDLFEKEVARLAADQSSAISGEFTFQLYDTFGFPVDLTRLLCDERGLTLDMDRFNALMEEQRTRARAARRSETVRALDVSTDAATTFTGFDEDCTESSVLEIHKQDDVLFVITDRTPFYAEMGGQVGDTGTLLADGKEYEVSGVQQVGAARAHIVTAEAALAVGDTVKLCLNTTRRRPIEAHHTATHLLHWALHKVVGPDAIQQGSLVDTDRLRFDFSSGPVDDEKIEKIEDLVNQRIKEDGSVSWKEEPYESVKGRSDIMQFFGDKYGDLVRVVQVGGDPGALNGYAMELCGGAHVRNTGAIGLFKIKSEGAIAAGVRRIEATCGEAAWEHLRAITDSYQDDAHAALKKLEAANARLHALGAKPVEVGEVPHLMPAMLVEKADIEQINGTLRWLRGKLEDMKRAAIDAEKEVKKRESADAARHADAALDDLVGGGGAVVAAFDGDARLVQELINGLKKRGFTRAALLLVDDGDRLHLATFCGPDAQAAGHKAGDILRELAALAGGKGGGRPESARGAAPDRGKKETLLTAAREKLGV